MSNNERIFGIHSVESFLQKTPERVLQLFLQKSRHDKKLQNIQSLADFAGIPVQQVDKRKMDDWVRGNHQGVIAEVQVIDAKLDENELLQLAENKTDLILLILDGVTDPHNLGACLRTADAAGVDAVVVPKDKSASLTPVARKVACGAAEFVPLVRVTNLARFLKQIKDKGVWVVGTAGEATDDIFSVNFSGATALVMGAEGDGMRRLTRENCDQLVKIPMAGSVSSLNVSVATGVCLFEMVRQANHSKK